MSYILNALRKSENERQSNQQQTLEKNIMPQNEQIKFSWLPLFIASIILLNLAFLVLFWINKDPSEEKAPSSPRSSTDHVQSIAQVKQKEQMERNEKNMPKLSDYTDQEDPNKRNKAIAKAEKNTRVTPVKPPVTANQPQPPIPENLPTNTQQAPVSLPDSAKDSIAKMIQIRQAHMQKRKQPDKIQSTLPPVPANMELQQPKNKLPDQQAKLPIATTVPVISSKKNIASDIEQPVTNKVAPVSPEKNDLPFLQNLPFEFRRNIPKLNINVFVYSENPSERFVMIDMVKYTSDQQILPGMDLKEIRDNSLVVTYKNKTFQIKRP